MKTKLKRICSYLYYKVVRTGGTPDYAARGWAIGMFIGCVIPMSFQLIISIPLAFLFKASRVGATLGTFITNPVTVFFIYPFQCWIGSKLTGGELTIEAAGNAMRGLINDQSFDAFAKLGTDLIISFFVGGFLLAAILTPLTYAAVFQLVIRYRKFREKRKKNTPAQ